jgi:hypothetical protein
MKRAILACKTIEAELRPLLPPDVEFRALDQSLHRTPEKLRESLQAEIDSLDAGEILLGYGLCGTGVIGLRSARARLVVPRVDDCIALLLGSLERYREEFAREPGTYWLSNGWIENAKDPFQEYQRCVEKWGEDTARWVAAEMMKGYRRLTLIDTGACPMANLRGYAREFADFFRLDITEMAGTDDLLRAIASPERGDNRLVFVEPGQEITMDMFLPALGTTYG